MTNVAVEFSDNDERRKFTNVYVVLYSESYRISEAHRCRIRIPHGIVSMAELAETLEKTAADLRRGIGDSIREPCCLFED